MAPKWHQNGSKIASKTHKKGDRFLRAKKDPKTLKNESKMAPKYIKTKIKNVRTAKY